MVFEAHSTDYQTETALSASGPRPLGDPQGRSAADLCPARGALRAVRHRGRAGARAHSARTSWTSLEERMLAEPDQWNALLHRQRASSSGCTAGTATATGCATTGRSRGCTRHSSGCSPTSRPSRSRCHSSASTCRRSTSACATASRRCPRDARARPRQGRAARVRRRVFSDHPCPRDERVMSEVSPVGEHVVHGAEHTTREIAQQPALWRQVPGSVGPEWRPFVGARAGADRCPGRPHRCRDVRVRRPGGGTGGATGRASSGRRHRDHRRRGRSAGLLRRRRAHAAGVVRPVRRQPRERCRGRARRPAADRRAAPRAHLQRRGRAGPPVRRPRRRPRRAHARGCSRPGVRHDVELHRA